MSAPLTSVPPEHIPPGMKALHVGVPFVPAAMESLSDRGCKRVFVLTNRSSLRSIGGGGDTGDDGDGDDGDDRRGSSPPSLVGALREAGLLAGPVCTSVGMGGGEAGLLRACDAARGAGADVVVTVGGGAIQDAGKLVGLWLSGGEGEEDEDGERKGASVPAILALAGRDPMPALPPQISIPNSFAMAEASSVAGITTASNVKSGASHPSLVPTVVIFDPAVGRGLPDWVRFGTALRCVEHAVGAITHPRADDDVRARASAGLAAVADGLRRLVANPECPEAQRGVYVGGFVAIRALMSRGCYPALGHLVENHYSARFGVHQGSCSGILCARILDYHRGNSGGHQRLVSAALLGSGVVVDDDAGGDGDVNDNDDAAATPSPAPRLVRDLVAALPGVRCEHAQVGVTEDMLREFSLWLFENHIERLNVLSPKSFRSADDIYRMMTKPLVDL
jgi:hypothetical protein